MKTRPLCLTIWWQRWKLSTMKLLEMSSNLITRSKTLDQSIESNNGTKVNWQLRNHGSCRRSKTWTFQHRHRYKRRVTSLPWSILRTAWLKVTWKPLIGTTTSCQWRSYKVSTTSIIHNSSHWNKRLRWSRLMALHDAALFSRNPWAHFCRRRRIASRPIRCPTPLCHRARLHPF